MSGSATLTMVFTRAALLSEITLALVMPVPGPMDVVVAGNIVEVIAMPHVAAWVIVQVSRVMEVRWSGGAVANARAVAQVESASIARPNANT